MERKSGSDMYQKALDEAAYEEYCHNAGIPNSHARQGKKGSHELFKEAHEQLGYEEYCHNAGIPRSH